MAKTTQKPKTPAQSKAVKTKSSDIGWGIDPEKYAAARKPKPKS